MPVSETQDEVVSFRTIGNQGNAPRPTQSETVDSATGRVTIDRGPSVVDETTREGGGKGRVLKESTLKLMEKLEKSEPASHEQGDADDDAPEAQDDPDDADAEVAADGESAEDGDADETEEGDEDKAPSEVDEARASASRLEEHNRALLAELEQAKNTPARERTGHEQTLVDAYAAYVDEGSVPALRKFIGAVIGAAPDSKDVDAELTGLYADLTARELNVPLDHSHQAMREASRARLALARDKRERAESEKKPTPANTGEAAQIETASRYIDNLLVTKGQSGTSIRDEFPMLMSLAEDFDGFKPAELLARAIKREYTVGTLDPRLSEQDAIRAVARKIEQHYEAVHAKVVAAKPSKKNTTNSGDPKKPAAADKASQDKRQNHGARTITNATASVAPGTKPKMKQKAATTEKARKDFPSDKAWREHLLSKHFND